MTCTACQHENRPDARFCLRCGAPLPRPCPACGRGLPVEAAFCDACGTRLADRGPGPSCAPATAAGEPASPASYTPRHLAERILTQRSALEGERKQVTVLFADLTNSVGLAEAVDPEEMHRLMDRAFQLMLAEVHRFEGTVNQFTGDGIMALFGAPVALEDAPVAAVRAALGIQRALEPLHHERREAGQGAFRMRVGIHTGPVVVGRIGDDLRMDYTAVGDTTNLAARLQQAARPGCVVISDTTRRLCEGFFDLAPLGELQLKGRSQPVAAFEVTGERPVESRLDARASVGLTPLVGRERELADLHKAFESTRAGHGQVVFLVGEAGLGKSRLRHEFCTQLQDQPHLWIEGRCSAYARSTSFHPLADAIRRGLGIDDRDRDAEALAKLARGAEALGEEFAAALPYLRWLLSLPVGDAEVEALDPITRRSETVRALQSLLLRAAERRPVVLVIEDLHWIDSATEDFLALVSDSIPASRTLLILSHRPGYTHPFGDRSFHSRVALHTLSEQEMLRMVCSILESDTLPPALLESIAEKAEGNPFFVEEVTQSLLEEGVLVRREGRVELRQDLARIAIPNRIQDVLMARIDRLSDEPKRAIQVASVIGREFVLRLLQRISELGEGVSRVVDDLRVLELIYEKASHPELAFMFKHALTRDVAYESVLRERRRSIHRSVGEAIEELYRDRLAEHYETLADHFSRGEDWERAFRYRELAAEKAVCAYANQAAVEHCRLALDLAPKVPGGVPRHRMQALEECLGTAENALSNFRGSGEAFLRAAQYAEGPKGRATNLARASWGLLWDHDYESARRHLGEAMEIARAHDLPAAEAMALVTRAESETVEHGDLRSEACDRAVALAEHAGEAEALAMAYAQYGQLAGMRGEWNTAVAMCERAIGAARNERLESLTIMPYWFLGISLTCLGRYERALPVFREAIALCDRIGDRALKSRSLNTLGWCYAELGCHEEAATHNRESAALAAEMVDLGLIAGAPEILANASINLAVNQIAMGRLDESLAQLEPIRDALEREGSPWMRWRYSLHLLDAFARWRLARREPEQALALALEELAGARRHGARKLEARALELRGRALVWLERHEEAEQGLEEALCLGRELGYPPVVWRALSLHSELARRAGDPVRAEHCADESRRIVEGLAAGLREEPIRARFGSLGEALASDPLGAYR